MGITGLLPFIKSSCRSTNIRDFKDVTVAVDAYSWLHKGAFSCAEKLVKGEKTDGYVHYCAKLLNMLLDAGVKIIMVFDGCNLHSKETTEKKRRENREKTRQRGKELLCEGKIREARECFQRCVDVTPEMAREVIQMCRRKNVDCIVAPYEADAQLAYLDKIGRAQIIITEDSDLVLFGCNKVLFKMDNFGGGLLYEKENLPKSFGSNASKFSFEKFRFMCILSGCDYLPSLPGIGLAKACKFFMLTSNPDLISVLKKLPSYLKMPKLQVSDDYIDSFVKANNTFLYQLVFCPQKKALVPLNDYPDGITPDNMEYAGKYLPDDVAVELAMGNINVKTMEKFDEFEDNSSSSKYDKSAIWVDAEVKPVKKIECSGFKFSSHKIKGVKRKFETLDTPKSERSALILKGDEEIFSMYRSGNTQEEYDYEEDPLADVYEKKHNLSSPIKSEGPATCEIIDLDDLPEKEESKCTKSSKLSLKRVVRSKFFVAKSERPELPNVLRENSPENAANKSIDEVPGTTSDALKLEATSEYALKPVIHSPIKSNKENMVNIFAKKKANPTPPSCSISEDITASLKKAERSWLDVIDNESSAMTSSGASEKRFTLNTTDSDCKTRFFDSNTTKVKKTRFISTKLLDFKFNKKSTLDKNLSLRSDGNSTFDSSKEDEEIEVVLDTSRDSVSFSENNEKYSFDCDFSTKNSCDLEMGYLPSSSNSAVNSSQSSSVNSSQSSLSEAVIRSLSLKPPSTTSLNKSSKCRQIGLSKKSKSSDKKLSIKDTLMSFNFVRKNKLNASVIT